MVILETNPKKLNPQSDSRLGDTHGGPQKQLRPIGSLPRSFHSKLKPLKIISQPPLLPGNRPFPPEVRWEKHPKNSSLKKRVEENEMVNF